MQKTLKGGYGYRLFNEGRDLREIKRLGPDLMVLDHFVFSEGLETGGPDPGIKTLLIRGKSL